MTVRAPSEPPASRYGRGWAARSALAAVTVALVGRLLGAGLPAAPLSQSGAVSRAFRFIMGTSIEVRAFGGDEERRAAAIEKAFAAFAEVDRLMSNWRDDSELAAVNRNAA